jgi:two-component system NarL family response regulator
VVDHHPVVREGWVAILNRQMDMAVVAETGSVREAIGLQHQHRPDITLMDHQLPEAGGAEAIRALAVGIQSSRIIVVTSLEGDEDIHQALAAGARAYLFKASAHEELVDAIRAVHAGARFVPPNVAAVLDERLQRPLLTKREKEVVSLITRGLSNKQIGYDLGLTEGTVKGHVNSLLAKLGAQDRAHAAITAIRRGFVRLGSADSSCNTSAAALNSMGHGSTFTDTLRTSTSAHVRSESPAG